MNRFEKKLPITVLIAVKNEAINLPRCFGTLNKAQRVIVLDSNSTDQTATISTKYGFEVVQFHYKGGYPKKRQWALENLLIDTPWIFLLDADEMITNELWDQIDLAISDTQNNKDAFLITKEFHFLGKRMRYGGFGHSAVLLFRAGKANFERLFDDDINGLDMEIHERIVVSGAIGVISMPLIHEDFKGLEAYINRHNKYSTWEAHLRYRYLETGVYGEKTITPKFFGNPQEFRRAIKALVIRLPFEEWMWFFYHYIFRMGFIEGRKGFIACQIRSSYIAQVRAKVFELRMKSKSK